MPTTLVDRYASVDPRTLGLTRVLLGALLLFDLAHRARAWNAFFAADGVCPTAWSVDKASAWGYFSLLHAFPGHIELGVLFALMTLVAVALLVGFRTKAAQVAALVLFTSLNARCLLVENGGYVVENLLLAWTCLLPLGSRFSVDALVAARGQAAGVDHVRAASEAPVQSFAAAGVLLQIAAIYGMNCINKTGSAWRDGTAAGYVFSISHYTSPLGGALHGALPTWLVRALTWTTLAFEGAVPVLVLAPFGGPWPRRAALVMILSLHIGFGVVLMLGPFAWSCCVLASLLVSRDDWEALALARRRRPLLATPFAAFGRGCARLARAAARIAATAPTRPPDAASTRLRRGAGEALACAFFLVCLNDAVATEGARRKITLPHVAALRGPLHAVRMFEDWAMWAPEPAQEDGTLVVDASTIDGRHVDPLRVASGHPLAVDFDFARMGSLVRAVDGRGASVHVTSLEPGQMWGMYLERVRRVKDLWPALAAYLRALPARTGHTTDALVGGDVYWVVRRAPPPGADAAPYTIQRLFSFDATTVTPAAP